MRHDASSIDQKTTVAFILVATVARPWFRLPVHTLASGRNRHNARLNRMQRNDLTFGLGGTRVGGTSEKPSQSAKFN